MNCFCQFSTGTISRPQDQELVCLVLFSQYSFGHEIVTLIVSRVFAFNRIRGSQKNVFKATRTYLKPHNLLSGPSLFSVMTEREVTIVPALSESTSAHFMK